MKILYICGDQGIPAFGRKGASTHIREMIAALRAHGCKILLAASDLSGDRRPEEDFPAESLPKPKSKKLGVDGRYLVGNFFAGRILQRLIREFRPDAIYERSALYFTAGEKAARAAGLPRILEVNCLLSDEQKTRLHFPGLARSRELGLIHRAPAVAAISTTMADRLIEVCEARTVENTRPFPMAVDPARFPRRQRNDALRAQLGWTPDHIVLGYVGSMNSYHRPAWFMDLAEKWLRKGDENIRFLVVGGIPAKVDRNRARLLKWVESGQVEFTGSVPQEAMGEWLAAMDCVLIPGAAPQSMPTKIFEAAATGRPLIMPATEPIKQLAGPESPLLFTSDDFYSFEKKAQEFCSNKEAIIQAAEDLHKSVVTDHTWSNHAIRLMEWFQELG